MGRSLLSQFLNLSNACPRFTHICGVNHCSSLYTIAMSVQCSIGQAKACEDNQHVFVPLAFDTFGSLAPEAIRFLTRVQQVIHSNISTPKGEGFVFSRFGFAIQKGVAAQLVARLPAVLISCGISSKSQRALPRIHRNHFVVGRGVSSHRCYCSGTAPEPTVSESSSTSIKKRIVSGVQPTGSIHLGNYLGAIKNWVSLQDKYETLFFIVDLHAITLPYDVQQLSKATRDTAALYLACGVDTSKASVFVQSHVRAHVELMWLLSSATPIGWLNRMIQFKEKSRKAGDDNVGVALLTYPVLMASDILLYQSDLVPVGEDQKQHLELTRELAERVNHLYGGRKWKKLGGRGGSIFKVPEPLIPPAGARVMSLTDGHSKMSKSAASDQSRINLLDSKDAIANKIKRCKTDSFPGLEFDNADRPECNNLLSVYQIITNKTKEEVALECQDMNWGTFKPILTDALIDHLHPIQTRYEEIMSDQGYLDQVLAEGASKAADIADVTLGNVYQAMGFLKR